jgi:hypothetical protein
MPRASIIVIVTPCIASSCAIFFCCDSAAGVWAHTKYMRPLLLSSSCVARSRASFASHASVRPE